MSNGDRVAGDVRHVSPSPGETGETETNFRPERPNRAAAEKAGETGDELQLIRETNSETGPQRTSM